jgi:UDP-N-acetylmuramyl pentapeptide phosphotransferase/UDP-N-acetylglucosamine-1-phosphate transferase
MSDAVVATFAPMAFYVLIAFLLALGVVRAAIAYAHRRGMFDQPGQRRSHKVPTPRGGGIGIIVAVVLTVPLCLLFVQPAWPMFTVVALIVAVVMVSWIGWWDDHRSLPALPRFGVQDLAVAIFCVALLIDGLPGSGCRCSCWLGHGASICTISWTVLMAFWRSNAFSPRVAWLRWHGSLACRHWPQHRPALQRPAWGSGALTAHRLVFSWGM